MIRIYKIITIQYPFYPDHPNGFVICMNQSIILEYLHCISICTNSYETGISVFQDWKINLSNFMLKGEINLDLHPCTSVLRCEKTIAFVLL